MYNTRMNVGVDLTTLLCRAVIVRVIVERKCRASLSNGNAKQFLSKRISQRAIVARRSHF